MTERSRGTSLLESLFAAAMASLFTATATRHAHQHLADLKRLREAGSALTAARNLVEASLAAPCGNPDFIAPCPGSLACRRTATPSRGITARPGEMLLTVEVEVTDRSDKNRLLARLATVASVVLDCSNRG